MSSDLLPSGANLITASASDLQNLLQLGDLTSVRLVEQCLAQIEKHDRRPGSMELRAMMFITRKEKLLKIAKLLDEERKLGYLRGPLHGIPVLLKDQWQVHPDYGMPTTAGMFALLEARNDDSAKLVKKLEEAGLIILGKTNMSEFGGGKASTTVGKSAIGGQCQSAYISGGVVSDSPPLDHSNPGGSSVGSAVGVSAGYAPLSIGTEASGSVTTPAARAALFGLVMTRETISLEGYLAISPTYASPGGMAKTVGDLRDLTKVMLEASNARDETKLPITEELDLGWKGLRLGFVNHDYSPFPDSLMNMDDEYKLEVKNSYEAAVAKIRDLGADVHYPIDFPPTTDPMFDYEGKQAINTLVCKLPCFLPLFIGSLAQQNEIKVGEVRHDLNAYLQSLGSSPVRSLEELILWNIKHPEAQDGLDQAQHIASQESTLSKEAHADLKAQMQKVAGSDTIGRVLTELNIDAIVGMMDMMLAGLTALAGCPCATMPLGVLSRFGRPYGLCLIARKYEEGTLLRIMGAYETTFPPRAIPTLLS